MRKRFNFPPGYGDNNIVALVRDPWWIFVYWEIRHDKEADSIKKLKDAGDGPDKYILRVYDVTNVDFNGKNARSHFDVELKGVSNSWYINVNSPGRLWVVDIGMLTKRNYFCLLARSNTVRTPRYGASEKLDAEWITTEENYWKMSGLSEGFDPGKSSFEIRELFKKRPGDQTGSSSWMGRK